MLLAACSTHTHTHTDTHTYICIYNQTQSMKKNLRTQTINQNKLRPKCPFLPHVRAQTHLQIIPIHSNQIHAFQEIPQTTRICSHFKNRPYKTTPKFLSDFTIPAGHHTTQKQYQNRKRIKRGHFFHSIPQ